MWEKLKGVPKYSFAFGWQRCAYLKYGSLIYPEHRDEITNEEVTNMLKKLRELTHESKRPD